MIGLSNISGGEKKIFDPAAMEEQRAFFGMDVDHLAELEQLGAHAFQRIAASATNPYLAADALHDKHRLFALLDDLQLVFEQNGLLNGDESDEVAIKNVMDTTKAQAEALHRRRLASHHAQLLMYTRQQQAEAAQLATARATAAPGTRLLPPLPPPSLDSQTGSNPSSRSASPMHPGRPGGGSASTSSTPAAAASGSSSLTVSPARMKDTGSGTPSQGGTKAVPAPRPPGGFAVPVGRSGVGSGSLPRGSPSPSPSRSLPPTTPGYSVPQSPFFLQSLIPQTPAASSWLASPRNQMPASPGSYFTCGVTFCVQPSSRPHLVVAKA